MTIDITKLIPVDKLDREETKLHAELKKGNFKLVNDKATLEKYATIFKHSNHERKAVSLRILKNDYYAIKAKALELGMPYQSLINSVIHRFLTGDLK